jgi:hypothetical protein
VVSLRELTGILAIFEGLRSAAGKIAHDPGILQNKGPHGFCIFPGSLAAA